MYRIIPCERIKNLFTTHDHSQEVYSACKNGDVDAVERLYRAGVNFNLSKKESPLWIACANGHLKVVKFLIDAVKVQLPVEVAGEDSFLHRLHFGKSVGDILISDEDYIELIEFLIDRGWDIDHRGKREETLLYRTCKSSPSKTSLGWEKSVESLIRKGANSNLRSSGDQTTPFWHACNSTLRIVKLFLRCPGLDDGPTPLSSYNTNLPTPLHNACEWEQKEIVRILLDTETGWSETYLGGETVLSICDQKRSLNEEIVKTIETTAFNKTKTLF